MLYILGFTGRSLLSLLHTPSNLTCVRGTVYTFTLTLGSTVLLVITIPKVRAELVIKAQDGCKGLTQYDLEV